MSTLSPILSAPNDSPTLNLGSSTLAHRIQSSQTNGAFAVVEFISEPGQGVGLHVHQREDELVYLLEGSIDVTLGDSTMNVSEGACALLPRGIPHGYVNTGATPSRLLAVLLPGSLDEFFVGIDRELGLDRAHEAHIGALCERFGLTFVENSRA
jgi:quercetin dioxygenase-like cupin family protein